MLRNGSERIFAHNLHVSVSFGRDELAGPVRSDGLKKEVQSGTVTYVHTVENKIWPVFYTFSFRLR